MAPERKTATDYQLSVLVADDKMRAWLLLNPSHPKFSPPTLDDVFGALQQANIELTPRARELAEAAVKLIGEQENAEQAEVPDKLLIAEGQDPSECVNARFEWDEQYQHHDNERTEDERINYFTLNSIITVEADARIGRLLPAQDGAMGADVYGAEKRPKNLRAKKIELGGGLKFSEEDPEAIVTTCPGRVVVSDSKMRVDEVLQVAGDVDFDTGMVDSTVSVDVRGAIRANFSVKTARDLTVKGTIEAAHVFAKGDVTCLKGLVGSHHHGEIRAGGSVTARFANEAVVRADRNVCIARSSVNSRIWAAGKLLIENGALIGGQAFAREEIVVRSLGSDACVKTTLAVGINPLSLKRVHELQQMISEREHFVEKVRSKVQPLISMMKRLTPEQREKATELLSRADELDMEIDDAREERERLLNGGPQDDVPRVVVQSEIHPGVRVSIGMREARFETIVHGPVAIEERKVNGATELVAVNRRTGSVTVLKTRELDLTPYEGLDAEDGAENGPDAGSGEPKES